MKFIFKRNHHKTHKVRDVCKNKKQVELPLLQDRFLIYFLFYRINKSQGLWGKLKPGT